MAKLLPRWEAKKYGVLVGEDHDARARIHYLSFADDTTLLAKSRHAMKAMLQDIICELGLVGLKLNAEKCKIQCSVGGAKPGAILKVGNNDFPLVPADEGFTLLGTPYTLRIGTRRELQQRLRIAWGKFHQIGHLLRHRSAGMKQRLRLFNAIVGRPLLWGSESWTLTKAERRKVRATQRSMLRRFAAPRRQGNEDWLDWVQRATRSAERRARLAGVHCWVQDHLRAKWIWAGHIGRIGSYNPNSWTVKVSFWRDSAWWAQTQSNPESFRARPLRPRPGRFARWDKEISNLAGPEWKKETADRSAWRERAAAFSQWSWPTK